MNCSKLALGTVQFGLNYGIANASGQISLKEGESILDAAKKYGIDTLDTAVAYGNSESTLGEIGVNDFQIVTKLPEVPKEAESDLLNWVEIQIQESFQKLNVTEVYGVLLHRPSQLLEAYGPNLFDAMVKLKEKGWVKKIGISIYQPDELDQLCQKFDFDLIQLPFNIIDKRFIETEWLKKLKNSNVEIHVRSVFLQGLLLMNEKQRPSKFKKWSALWNVWDGWLNKNRLTPLEATIRYVASIQEISKIIIGVDSISQLEEIINAMQGVLPEVPDELATNDTALLNPANWN